MRSKYLNKSRYRYKLNWLSNSCWSQILSSIKLNIRYYDLEDYRSLSIMAFDGDGNKNIMTHKAKIEKNINSSNLEYLILFHTKHNLYQTFRVNCIISTNCI